MAAESNHHVELPSGGTWEVKPFLTHAARDEMEKAARIASFETMRVATESGLDLAALIPTQTNGAKASATTELGSEEKNALLLESTAGWSFDEPVTAEQIGERDHRDTDAVVAYCVKLYELRTPVDAEDEAAGKEHSAAMS